LKVVRTATTIQIAAQHSFAKEVTHGHTLTSAPSKELLISNAPKMLIAQLPNTAGTLPKMIERQRRQRACLCTHKIPVRHSAGSWKATSQLLMTTASTGSIARLVSLSKIASSEPNARRQSESSSMAQS
jgi:hypothetical protein